MKGKIIVCEGLDCSGKTTLLREALSFIGNNFVYVKCMGSDTWMGRIARSFPSTFTFSAEFIFITFFKLIPNLLLGKTILADRYDVSIFSYVPLTNRVYNRIILKLLSLFVIKPSAIIYLYISWKKRLKRLLKKGTKYELLLAKNSHLIQLREKIYLDWFNKFEGNKMKIDTGKNNLKNTLNKFFDFVSINGP